MQGMQVAAGAAFAPPYATECAMTLTAYSQKIEKSLDTEKSRDEMSHSASMIKIKADIKEPV